MIRTHGGRAVVLAAALAVLSACADSGREESPPATREARPAVADTPAGAAADSAGPAPGMPTTPEATGAADVDSAGATPDPGAAGPPPPPAGSGISGYDTVFVYFSGPITDDDLYGPLVAVPRAVPDTADPLAFALLEQLNGPTQADMEAYGPLSSWFSDRTAGMLRGVGLEDGLAVLDFEDFRSIISGASTSAGSTALLRQVAAVAFQFPQARRLELRIDGSCSAIMDWLQYGCIRLGRSSYTDFEGHRLAVPAGGGVR